MSLTVSTGHMASSYLPLLFPVTASHAAAPRLLPVCPRVLPKTWRIGRPACAALVRAFMPGKTSGREGVSTRVSSTDSL